MSDTIEARHSDALLNLTAGSDLGIKAPTYSTTRSDAAATAETGYERQVAHIRADDLDDAHRETHLTEWRGRVARRSQEGLVDLLDQLADLGFAWRDIARMVGVSVPAVQKWRRGDNAKGESRGAVAALLGACDLITNHYEISHIASWFEVPLPGSPVTPIDLYAADRVDLVFEYAATSDPDAILTLFDESWHETYRTDFETFRAGDGRLSVRRKA